MIIYNAKKDIGILVMSGPGPWFDWAFANIGVRDATRRRVIGCIRLCGASPALLASEWRRAVLSWGPRGWKITRTLTCTDSTCACPSLLVCHFPSRGSHMPDEQGAENESQLSSTPVTYASFTLNVRKVQKPKNSFEFKSNREKLVIIYI